MEPKYVKILVVDDESSVRNVLKRILDGKGYLSTIANDSGEARKHLETQYFDILICDIRMPGESGLDLIRYVKSEFPETAIIMVTGVDDPKETEAAMNLGVFGYLLKPFQPNQILITISNTLKLNELDKKDEIIGKYPKDIWKGYDVELHSSTDRDAIQEGHRGEIKYEALINYPDRSIHDVIFNKGVYRNINEQISGIINVIQDITEMKTLRRKRRGI
jgi:CheY-like chemotaxis protein